MPPKKTSASGFTKPIKSIMPARNIMEQSTSRLIPTKSGPVKGKGIRAFGSGEVAAEELDYIPFQARALIKPEDQLVLVADALKEDIPRMLNTKNPQIPSNLVDYSFKDRCYMPAKPTGPAVQLFSFEGCVLHKDSDEAIQQLLFGPVPVENILPVKRKRSYTDDDDEDESPDEARAAGAAEPEQQPEAAEAPAEEGAAGDAPQGEAGAEAPEEPPAEEGVEGEGAQQGEGEPTEQPPAAADDEPEPDVIVFGQPKKIKNQFNFCERAAMSYNNPFRDMQIQTVPPCIETYSGQVMQWIIFDTLQDDYDTQQKLKEAEKEVFEMHPKHSHDHAKQSSYKEEMKLKEAQALEITKKKLLAAKTIERMICQNIYDEISQDFRYWDDPADNWCEEGTLLPLWKFVFEKTQRQTITSICWNPCYFDFFAVSFGYYSFTKLYTKGAVCLWSLKNPSYPEYTYYRESGVMSVDIHPKYPSLIVLGMTDGSVAVFNVQRPSNEVQTESDTASGKHAGVVWQVKWAPDTPDDEINFYSISNDGLVYNWILMFDRLEKTLILPLTIIETPIQEPDGTVIRRSLCGSAIAFHPTNPLVFLAGTEDGPIYQCSTLYSSVPLLIYKGHTMPIHRIHYNTHYPSIFASCSQDWRIKIWEDGRKEPLFMFDLGCPVGDVEWAPFSSTLFAAVTLDGRVCVYDLHLNKYEPICTQFVVSKRRNHLTRISFNNKFPFIAVGDDKGCITTLKLSPNLRRKVKPPKKGPVYTERELEIMKLQKVLLSVLEPVTLILPSNEVDMPPNANLA